MSQDLSMAFDEKIRSFWDLYIRSLHVMGIHPPFDRWYVRRAEAYIDAHKGRKLAEQGPADVDTYLAEAGRRTGLHDWQYRQIVDAIQKLFEFVGVVGVGRFGPLARFLTQPMPCIEQSIALFWNIILRNGSLKLL